MLVHCKSFSVFEKQPALRLTVEFVSPESYPCVLLDSLGLLRFGLTLPGLANGFYIWF